MLKRLKGLSIQDRGVVRVGIDYSEFQISYFAMYCFLESCTRLVGFLGGALAG